MIGQAIDLDNPVDATRPWWREIQSSSHVSGETP
jgi:hypothetical protein